MYTFNKDVLAYKFAFCDSWTSSTNLVFGQSAKHPRYVAAAPQLLIILLLLLLLLTQNVVVTIITVVVVDDQIKMHVRDAAKEQKEEKDEYEAN